MLVSILAAAFALFSPQFGAAGSLAGAPVWNRDGYNGANRSPALRWAHPPARTKGSALGVGFPPASPSVKQGVNDFGAVGYGGPCPPAGAVHHYIFTLYALDVAHLAASLTLRGKAFVQLIRRHIIATATVTGIYGR